MFRSILAVVLGYAFIALGSVSLLVMSGSDPDVRPDIPFMVGSIVVTGLVAFGGGYFAARIAARRELLHAIIVGSIVELIAVLSMFAAPDGASLWSQWSSILVLAPAAMFGGLFRVLQGKKPPNARRIDADSARGTETNTGLS
jgi:O-antigen/teichoic acid export membrane protein